MTDHSDTKILIVEDNVLNMKLFNDLLTSQKYKTIECFSGLEAINMANEHQPDLIIMDIQLPEISGLDLIAQLKADPKFTETPIIAVTAFAMKGDEERVRSSGCDDYLSKPISISHFLATVEKNIR